MCRPDDSLQVFISEVDVVEANAFGCTPRCLQEGVYVEIRVSSDPGISITIDIDQLEAGWSAVAEETGEVIVFI